MKCNLIRVFPRYRRAVPYILRVLQTFYFHKAADTYQFFFLRSVLVLTTL